MARYAKFTMVIGQRETGKSNKTITQSYKAVTEGRKVLIADFRGEYGSYIYRADQPPHSIKTIFLKQVPRFTAQIPAEIVRICQLNDDGSPMDDTDKLKSLAYIFKNYFNGILLVEDTNDLISDTLPRFLVGALGTLRQRGVDVIMNFQLLQKAAHPKLFGLANYIRMHYVNGNVAEFDGFRSRIDIMSVAQIIVNNRYAWGIKNQIKNEKGQFFNVTIHIDHNKIHGIFTKEEAHDAVEMYMGLNGGQVVKRELSRVNKQGNRIWKNYNEAYNFLENKMMDDFFVF